MDKTSKTVMSFVRAVAAGDRRAALALCSPDFGVSAGMGVEQHVEWEIEQFGDRLWLLEGGYATERVSGDDRYAFFAIHDARGRFLFEDEYFFDDSGRICGNQRPCDVVTKVMFSARGNFRAAAVQRPVPKHVRVLDAGVFYQKFGQAFCDGESRIEFAVEGDDLKARTFDLRIMMDRGASSVAAHFRGVDHRHFVPNMYPQIAGRTVHVPVDRMNIWCVHVTLADGAKESVYHPQIPEYTFAAPVVSAHLTDALDNDWETKVP